MRKAWVKEKEREKGRRRSKREKGIILYCEKGFKTLRVPRATFNMYGISDSFFSNTKDIN